MDLCITIFMMVSLVLLGTSDCIAQVPEIVAGNAPAPTSPSGPLAISSEQARESVQWLVDLAARQLPPSYEGDDNWGDTKRVWAGVSMKREGLELKTHRRFKEVRHARWVKYKLSLPPELSAAVAGVSDAGAQSNLVTVHRVVQTPEHRWQVTGSVVSPLNFDCRVERWNLGFQWYSVHVAGHLRVRMDFTVSLAMNADYSEIPPAVVIDPKVEVATLYLEHFEVDRISKLGGDVAEELGDVLEKIIRETWLDRENARLADRINQSIAKKRDKLRFSSAAWFAKWQ